MVRSILGFVAGLIAGFITVAAVESLSWVIFPPPAELDMNDVVAMRAFVQSLPIGALLLVLLAHAAGSFVAAAVCTVIANRTWFVAAVILGTLFLLAGIANLAMIPHPAWFGIVDMLLYIPLALLGCWFAGRLFLKPPPNAA